MANWGRWIGLASLLLAFHGVSGHEDQRYLRKEAIPLLVDTVGPRDNPQESYSYYKLPFCQPEQIHHKVQSLGEVLQGSEKVYSPYLLRFQIDTKHEDLCEIILTPKDQAQFIQSIEDSYMFHAYFDEIPIRGEVGEVDETTGVVSLYTHYGFTIQYNEDRVIAVELDEKSKKVRLGGGDEMKAVFSFSVAWKETAVSFEDRPSDNPSEWSVEQKEVQWFSIANATVLAILLAGVVAYIVLSMLRKDLAMFDEEEDPAEQRGWKVLYGDVFRYPPYPCVFSAAVGIGVQFLLLFVVILTLSVMGLFYRYGRGTMYAAIVVVYALTALISGGVSADVYKKFEGEEWPRLVVATATLFAGPVFGIWSIVNTVGWMGGSTVALPFGTIVALGALYVLVTIPLTMAGVMIGKMQGAKLETTCKTREKPTPIPDQPWFKQPWFGTMVCGFLLFGACYVEMFYVFSSLWGEGQMTPYGILYLVFVILLVLTACGTATMTYLSLSNGNHRWWWYSFTTGGATAIYMLIYSFFFVTTETRMSGAIQMAYYSGYMLIICYGVFLMLGSVGFFGAYRFCTYIFNHPNAKIN